MRGTRWLLLVAIVAIVGGVAFKYRAQKRALEAQAPATPPALPNELNSRAHKYSLRESDHKTGRKKFDLDAEDMSTPADSSRVDLKNVTMNVYAKDGKSYDLVTSAAA